MVLQALPNSLHDYGLLVSVMVDDLHQDGLRISAYNWPIDEHDHST
jgi:hypothetical protein